MLTFSINGLTSEELSKCQASLGESAHLNPVSHVGTTDEPTTVPVAAVPVAAVPVAVAGDLDVNGVEWSAEHHAATKTTKTDGGWKAKKGGDKAARVAYEALFTTPTTDPLPPGSTEDAPVVAAVPAIPAAVPAIPAAVPVAAAAPVAAAVPVAPVAALPVAPVAALPVAPVAALPVAPVGVGAVTHAQMMTRVTKALQDKIVTATDIPKICAAFGINTLKDCEDRADIYTGVYNVLTGATPFA